MPSKNYLDDTDWPHLQIRVILETERGDVTTFLVKLEYNLRPATMAPDNWVGIARFDHNPLSQDGHDIEDEGLHLDIMDIKGQKIDVRRSFPEKSANDAPDFCQRWFRKNSEMIAKGFEDRHNIDGKYSG